MERNNLYTYGFLNTPVASLTLPIGIADRVLLVSNVGVSALVEPEVDIESIKDDDKRSIEAVLSHDRVIYQIFRQTTVLPLRFGTSFASEESLLNHLKVYAQEYLKKLNQLDGKSEYLLKFIPLQIEETNIPTTEAGGRQYFLAKKQRYQTQQEFSILQKEEWKNIVETIDRIYKSTIVIQNQDDKSRIYLLISGEEEALLTEQFLAWQADCPRWELQLGEALPPYHFM